jgi:hypothetical protein
MVTFLSGEKIKGWQKTDGSDCSVCTSDFL